MNRDTDLGDHVHAHGVSCLGLETDVKVSPRQTDLQLLEPGEPVHV